VRFFLDNDVPISVGRMMREHGHRCWTAAEAGLAAEGQDDNLTVYAAEQGAVLVISDREFSQRRKKNPIGRHIWLHCLEPDAAAVLAAHLADVDELLRGSDVMVTVTRHGVKAAFKWS
jgi:predicted nuclease of predicted toxin-antitoxin system